MASMKYIKDEFGRFVIFSNQFKHKDVAEALNINARSAGSIALIDDQFGVNGESTSLRVRSNPEDASYIKRQLDFYDGN
jgi:hypothetical protein